MTNETEKNKSSKENIIDTGFIDDVLSQEQKEKGEEIPKGINQKLYMIMKDIERIEKDRTNTNQNYDYSSEKIIKERLHTMLVKYKVLFSLMVVDIKELGKFLIINCEYCFTDVEDNSTLRGMFVGSGHNRDDKGVYAAITGAIKYIMTSTFLIPTGDDPEKDEPTENNAGVVGQKLTTENIDTTIQGNDPNVCKKCGGKEFNIKVAGDASKNPGKKYYACSNCKDFHKWA